MAVAEGYAPIPCASGLQGGAMGVHYVNGDLLKDGVVDIAKPEAVMYEPTADGKMDLVAVEYIAFKGPAALDGHLFNFVTEPNRYGLDKFYELHVWAWRPNPTGSVCRQQSECELRRHARRGPLAHILGARHASQDRCKFPAGQIRVLLSHRLRCAKITAAIERRRITRGARQDWMITC